MSSAVHRLLRTVAAPEATGTVRRAAISGSVGEYPTLAREFRMIVFDWDGTAVANRMEDASALARLAEPLLADGCWLVVVTGTSFDHIARQFCDLVSPDCRARLVVCANRGSEVFGFDEHGEAVVRYRREATPAEDQALTAIAEAVRDELVRATRLDVGIVYNRLNRRKIDLIPLPEWADPPKAEIGALRQAVETRLAEAGWHGGIAGVVELAERQAARAGIEVRITSDVKHVEVGLTDKADSIAWIKRELMALAGIGEDKVLVAGDEFGPIGGFPGSDNRLRVGLEAAPTVSVGAEPAGAPAGVVHLGGGPHAFRAVLARQIARRCPLTDAAQGVFSRSADRRIASLLAPSSPSNERAGWALTIEGVRPELEHPTESLLTIGNGFLGVRGSLVVPHPASRPETLVAGLFGVTSEAPTVPRLMSAPDWLRVRFFVDGEPITLESADEADQLTRMLDLRHGLLRTSWPGRGDHATRITRMSPVSIQTLRLVSQVRRGLGVQIIRLEAVADATITLQSWLQPPSDGLQPCTPDVAESAWRTPDGAYALGCRTLATLSIGEQSLRSVVQRGVEGRQTWSWAAKRGEVATFVRLVSFARGNEPTGADHAAEVQLADARAHGVGALLAEHVAAWKRLWDASDIRITGDDVAQRQVRFAIYHLLSAANPDDERVSIGARGLTGDAYLGHVFWDTDIFLIPFYTAAWPAAARAILMYRYHTLPAARRRAAELGYRGAFYAWESTDTGADVTPREVYGPNGTRIVVRCGTEEVHISADVAYAVWHYWITSRDHDFLLNAGAEIVLETARFWGSRCALEPDGHYHIRHVIGPDEYHEEVDDNAYTNGMVRWNLQCALKAARLISARWPNRWRELVQCLALTNEEMELWRDISARMEFGVMEGTQSAGVDEDPHVIEQFAGYFNLEPMDLGAYDGRTVPMDVILGRERIQATQVVKQADVVMLLALLPDQFSRRCVEANYHYYEPRCGHGSSLSPAMHALIAARLGEVETAERYYHQAAEIDLNEDAGAAALGVHMAALGGLWSSVAFGFGGLWTGQGGLRIEPHLPDRWRALEVPVQWRGRRLRYRIQTTPHRITVQLARGSPSLEFSVGNLRHRLRDRDGGGVWRCWWDDATSCWKEETA